MVERLWNVLKDYEHRPVNVGTLGSQFQELKLTGEAGWDEQEALLWGVDMAVL